MKFSLMFFGYNKFTEDVDPYKLYIDAAEFADQRNFEALWIPERHFTELGSAFPNPGILLSAIAQKTERLKLRAGSVVAPLHHPVIIAENWAMLDQLSHGRMGLSLASGWHANDFALCPDNFEGRHKILFSSAETVRQLWRGESLECVNGLGQTAEIHIPLPPKQAQIPIWITSAGNLKTITTAGEKGHNLLTHVYNNDLDVLSNNIKAYRQSHPENKGWVSVMVHTFMGSNSAEVLGILRETYRDYLKANKDLLIAGNIDDKEKINKLNDRELNEICDFVFDRLYNGRALLGTPQDCLEYAKKLNDIGVDEVLCLLDFGLEPEIILSHLPYIEECKNLFNDYLGNTVSATRVQEEIKSDSNLAPNASILIDLNRYKWNLSAQAYYAEVDKAYLSELIYYGPDFRCIKHIYYNDSDALGLLEIGFKQLEESSAYRLHPVIWDNAFQILGILAYKEKNVPAIHTGYKKISYSGDPSNRIWVLAERTSVDKENNTFVGNIKLLSESGDPIAQVDGIIFKYLNDETQLVRPADTDHQDEENVSLDNIQGFIIDMLHKKIGGEAQKFRYEMRLIDLGVDSLMSLGIKNEIDKEFGVSFPAVTLLSNPSIQEIIERIHQLAHVNNGMKQDAFSRSGEEDEEINI